MDNRGEARGSLRGGRFYMNRGQARGSLRGGRFSMNRCQARGNPRGGSNSLDGCPPHRHRHWTAAGTSDDYSGNKEFWSKSEMDNPQPALPRDVSNHSEHKNTSSSKYQQEWRPSGRKDTFSHAEPLKEGQNTNEYVGVNSKELKCLVASVSLNQSGNLHMKGDIETSLPCKWEAGDGPVSVASPLNTTGRQNPELSEVPSTFDLCPTKSGSTITLKAPLLVQNRERRNEIMRSMEQKNGSVLQSGMVLLKSYISLNDQANIVKLCRNLGLGAGGFYQPSYRDGAKLNLKMMCLGKNWDPETSNYGDYRPIDRAKPPTIPKEFFQLVESAIRESQSLIRNDSKATSSELILPWMSPDICLVNFYSSSGRLGLHQDRDESEESLHKGLPVVSFSIGDTAEFLYGDQRDIEKANKVLLESGDVLMFGGKSRHVFHGVASIQPNTAPKTLLEKTNLRPGRLNLTFRQY